MGWSVRELRSRLTHAEFVEWMAFSLLEPFGDAREDERARGMMAMPLVAQGVKGVDPSSFLKTWEPPQEASPADALQAFVEKMDALAGYSGEPPSS